MPIRKGSIVWAYIDDPNGRPIVDKDGNPKPHPTVVITPTEEILRGDPVAAAAVSTLFDARNLLSGEFLMPWAPGGHPITGLDQPCVVKSYWLTIIDPNKITRAHPGERAKSSIVRQVLNWLNQQT